MDFIPLIQYTHMPDNWVRKKKQPFYRPISSRPPVVVPNNPGTITGWFETER